MATLYCWMDHADRVGPAHMALDEALLSVVSDRPVLRVYCWPGPAITIGVFTPRETVAHRPEPVTRRWTGGGVVEHGHDLTFALAIPQQGPGRNEQALARYRRIHEALAAALLDSGFDDVRVCDATDPAAGRFCFAAPVACDVIRPSTGEKLAGGAQRRSRLGLLHQGSVRLPAPWDSLDHPWIAKFAARLGEASEIPAEIRSKVLAAAEPLENSRYSRPEWLASR